MITQAIGTDTGWHKTTVADAFESFLPQCYYGNHPVTMIRRSGLNFWYMVQYAGITRIMHRDTVLWYKQWDYRVAEENQR